MRLVLMPRDENVIRYSVPRIVDRDEEQHEGRTPNRKQRYPGLKQQRER